MATKPYHDVLAEYPTYAIPAIVDILRLGKEQGHKLNSWRSVSITEHVLAGLGHAVSFLRGRDDEPHLKQALCRLAMAVDLSENPPKG